MEWSPGIIIALFGLLSGGVTTWVMMNNKVTRLETKVEALEKDAINYRADTTARIVEMGKELKNEYAEMKVINGELHRDVMKIMFKLGISE